MWDDGKLARKTEDAEQMIYEGMKDGDIGDITGLSLEKLQTLREKVGRSDKR